jgi:small subunit ribosomal protein S1
MEQKQSNRQAFAALLESEEYSHTGVRRGEVREAAIIAIGENDMMVDLGAKRDGIIPPGDLDLLEDEYLAGLKVGDLIPVVIRKTRGHNDELVVSLNLGLQQQDWLQVKELLDSGDTCQANVTEQNRGGVVVSYGELRGFVPNSQLASIPRGMRGERLEKAKVDLIGQTLVLVVIEVDQRRQRLIYSERAASNRNRQQLLEELAEGTLRTGKVSNLVDFGAFVDLGGIDGLIHISELAWHHVTHPHEVLSIGDEVEVLVLSVDKRRERIGLSRKQLLPDPWEVVTEDLQEGTEVEGTITGKLEFGALVDIGEGVEGLAHVSKMADGETTLAGLERGSPVVVRVLTIDHRRRRIALNLEHPVRTA